MHVVPQCMAVRHRFLEILGIMSDLSASIAALERSRTQLSVSTYFDAALFGREMELIYQSGPRYLGHALAVPEGAAGGHDARRVPHVLEDERDPGERPLLRGLERLVEDPEDRGEAGVLRADRGAAALDVELREAGPRVAHAFAPFFFAFFAPLVGRSNFTVGRSFLWRLSTSACSASTAASRAS